MSDEMDYTLRQKLADAEHRKIYARWFESLSPAEQRALSEAEGLSQSAKLNLPFVKLPSRKRREKGREEDERVDQIDRSGACEMVDYAGNVDTLSDWMAERFGLEQAAAEAVAKWHCQAIEIEARTKSAFLFHRLIAGFIAPGNLRIRAGALAFAANLGAINGMKSIREFAAKIGVSPWAVSKEKRNWQELLDLPSGPHGKTDEARRNFSEAQKQKHWRKKKCKTSKAAA